MSPSLSRGVPEQLSTTDVRWFVVLAGVVHGEVRDRGVTMGSVPNPTCVRSRAR